MPEHKPLLQAVAETPMHSAAMHSLCQEKRKFNLEIGLIVALVDEIPLPKLCVATCEPLVEESDWIEPTQEILEKCAPLPFTLSVPAAHKDPAPPVEPVLAAEPVKLPVAELPVTPALSDPAKPEFKAPAAKNKKKRPHRDTETMPETPASSNAKRVKLTAVKSSIVMHNELENILLELNECIPSEYDPWMTAGSSDARIDQFFIRTDATTAGFTICPPIIQKLLDSFRVLAFDKNYQQLLALESVSEVVRLCELFTMAQETRSYSKIHQKSDVLSKNDTRFDEMMHGLRCVELLLAIHHYYESRMISAKISDSTLLCCANFSKNIIVNIIIDACMAFTYEENEIKESLIGLYQELKSLLTLLYSIFQDTEGQLKYNENVVMTVGTLAVQCATSGLLNVKSSGRNALKQHLLLLQHNSMPLLCWIFCRRTGLRSFILDEVLTVALAHINDAAVSIKRKTADVDIKFHATSFTHFGAPWSDLAYSMVDIGNGQTIHLVSWIILTLTQSLYADWYDYSPQCVDITEQAVIASMTFVWKHILKMCDKAVSSVDGKKNKNDAESAMIAESRIVLDCLVGDCINLLCLRNWPVAAVSLNLLVPLLLDNFRKDNEAFTSSAHIRSMSLDYLTWIVSKASVKISRLNEVFNGSEYQSLVSVPAIDIEPEAFAEVCAYVCHNLDAQDVARAWTHQVVRNLRVTEDGLKQHMRVEKDHVWSEAKDVEVESDLQQKEALPVLLQIHGELFKERLFDAVTTRLIQQLHDSLIDTRKKSIRLLLLLVASKNSLTTLQSVKNAFSALTSDSSPSVRDVALEAIEKLIQGGVSSADFYETISSRVLDTGVNVRKRAVRMLAEMASSLGLDSPQSRKTAVDISFHLAKRAIDSGEDASVSSLTLKLIYEMWFQCVDNGSKKVSKVEQTLNMIAELTTMDWSSAALISTVIEKLLLSKATAQYALVIKAHSKTYAEIIMQRLLAPVDQDSIAIFTDKSKKAANLNLLMAFAKHCPEILVTSWDPLRQMLDQFSNESDDVGRSILCSLIELLTMTFLLFSRSGSADSGFYEFEAFQLDMSVITQFQLRLLSVSLKQSSAVVSGAMIALCQVSTNLAQDLTIPTKLLLQCVEYLQAKSYVAIHDSNVRSIIRALYISGFIGQHLSLGDTTLMDVIAAGKVSASVRTLMTDDNFSERSLFQIFTHYATLGDNTPESVTSAALTALGCLLEQYSKLITEPAMINILDASLARSNSQRQCALKIINDFLIADERRVREKQISKSSSSEESDPNIVNINVLKLQSEDTADGNNVTGVVQRYMPHVLKDVISENASLREICFDIICHIARQGLAHPLQCTHVLIAFACGGDAHLSINALKLYTEMSLKYHSFIHKNDMDGVKLAYGLSIHTRGSASGFTSLSHNSFVANLAPLYDVVKAKRPLRRDFLGALLGFITAEKRLSKDHLWQTELMLIRFVADNLASFEYKTIEEPLFVLHSLNRHISTVGVEIGNLINENNAISDLVIYQGATVAIAIVLKKYLQSSYGITDFKCESYQPSGAANVNDKAPLRKIDSPIGWSRVSLLHPDTIESVEEDDRALFVQQFLSLIESISGAAGNDEEEDSVPTNKRKIKSADNTPSNDNNPINKLNKANQSTVPRKANKKHKTIKTLRRKKIAGPARVKRCRKSAVNKSYQEEEEEEEESADECDKENSTETEEVD